MRNLLSLPSTLLLLLATSSWTNGATDDTLGTPIEDSKRSAERGLEEFWKRDGTLGRRDDAIKRRMLGQSPVAVKKMSNDPRQKFYPEYWQFGIYRPTTENSTNLGNHSMAQELFQPFLPHSDDTFIPFSKLRSFPRNIFEKRGYQCPTGTSSCSSIGYTNSCCATDETCVVITDTGLGDVGCCPNGQTCEGSVSSCDTAAGYTSCSNSTSGGCCIPGYTCDSVGCIAGGTVTIIASSTSPITTSTSYEAVVTTATVLLTQVVTITTSSSVLIETVYITTTTPTSTAYIGLSTAQTTIFTTVTEAVPAVRPTSDSSSTTVSTVTTTIATLSSSTGYCPTGFYQCSAYYEGGCCQVGVDCDTSSCAASTTTTVVAGSAVTVVVATGYGVTTVTTSESAQVTTVTSAVSSVTAVAITSTTMTSSGTAVVVVASSTTTVDGDGACAAGWYGCAAADGGGCCPTGYSCAASCIATQANEPGHVYKVPANHASSSAIDGIGKCFLLFAGFVTAFGMVML